MCVVSMIGDQWRDAFPVRHPGVYPYWPAGVPYPVPPAPNGPVYPLHPFPVNALTREEFDVLKRDVEALKLLLEAAKKYDEDTGQPDCHQDEKVEFLRKIAEFVGVDLETVFGNKKEA